mmetsp:Transcript_48560/g.105268  ORF Transcript_48560/g.105268 Transcript_48560/m.105268 type:complete len:222 (-) Transcript_48560:84-749(-)
MRNNVSAASVRCMGSAAQLGQGRGAFQRASLATFHFQRLPRLLSSSFRLSAPPPLPQPKVSCPLAARSCKLSAAAWIISSVFLGFGLMLALRSQSLSSSHASTNQVLLLRIPWSTCTSGSPTSHPVTLTVLPLSPLVKLLLLPVSTNTPVPLLLSVCSLRIWHLIQTCTSAFLFPIHVQLVPACREKACPTNCLATLMLCGVLMLCTHCGEWRQLHRESLS